MSNPPHSPSSDVSDRDGRAPSESRVIRTRRHLSTPPYNPGLHDLITGKQQWDTPLDAAARERGFLGWHARGYLPHYDAPFTTQFVTFRLHDALPVSRRAEWEALLKIENDRERRLQLEDYLDRSHGECHLRAAPVAKLVQDALRYFDGQRYQLNAWVVMPNHVHVLFNQQNTPLGEIMHSWRSFTAKEANKLLDQRGQFWEEEYFDTFIRDEAHYRRVVRYIESNPVKAGLSREPADWPWSSAAPGARASRPLTTPDNPTGPESPSSSSSTQSDRDGRAPSANCGLALLLALICLLVVPFQVRAASMSAESAEFPINTGNQPPAVSAAVTAESSSSTHAAAGRWATSTRPISRLTRATGAA